MEGSIKVEVDIQRILEQLGIHTEFSCSIPVDVKAESSDDAGQETSS